MTMATCSAMHTSQEATKHVITTVLRYEEGTMEYKLVMELGIYCVEDILLPTVDDL